MKWKNVKEVLSGSTPQPHGFCAAVLEAAEQDMAAECRQSVTIRCSCGAYHVCYPEQPDTLAQVVEAIKQAQRRYHGEVRVILYGAPVAVVQREATGVWSSVFSVEPIEAASILATLASIAPEPKPTVEEDSQTIDTLFTGPVPLAIERAAWERIKRRLREGGKP